MTTLQLRVAIATKELGSISAAAKKLNISQPNASNCIKALEAEIGYPIFRRAKAGISLTEKSELFLEHARKILLEHDSILELQNLDSVYQLRLGSANYHAAFDPFLKLCHSHQDDKECDFKYANVTIKDGVAQLDSYSLDIVFAPLMYSQLAAATALCEKHSLEMIPICELPGSVSVRKGHPAALDGRCENLTQGSDALKEFPYAAYLDQIGDETSTGYSDSDFVQCSYKIIADGADARLRLVAATNAFSFGVMASKSFRERYGLVSFPVPGIFLKTFCIIRHGEAGRREIREYIELLRQELNPET